MPQLAISLRNMKPEADLLIRAYEGHRKGGVRAFLVAETELHSNLFLSMGVTPVSFFFLQPNSLSYMLTISLLCQRLFSIQKESRKKIFLNESVGGALSFYLFFNSRSHFFARDPELLNKNIGILKMKTHI